MHELGVVNCAAAPQQRPKVASASVPYWRLLRCCSQRPRGGSKEALAQGLLSDKRPLLP